MYVFLGRQPLWRAAFCPTLERACQGVRRVPTITQAEYETGGKSMFFSHYKGACQRLFWKLDLADQDSSIVDPVTQWVIQYYFDSAVLRCCKYIRWQCQRHHEQQWQWQGQRQRQQQGQLHCNERKVHRKPWLVLSGIPSFYGYTVLLWQSHLWVCLWLASVHLLQTKRENRAESSILLGGLSWLSLSTSRRNGLAVGGVSPL